jgi:hypothetical protein
LPDPLAAWLEARGWYRRGLPNQPPPSDPPEAPPRAQVEDLRDVPVPIDSWDTFDTLFAWDERPVGEGSFSGTTYLGAAVRSFFAQGGRRCYVVRVSDPPPFLATRVNRQTFVEKLIPGVRPGGLAQTNMSIDTLQLVAASPQDRRSWRGVAHLFGLPDVSFVCLPDLADLLGVDRPQPDLRPPQTPGGREVFVECSTGEPLDVHADQVARRLTAPGCDRAGYRDWASAVQSVVCMIKDAVREAILLAAIPMPVDDPDLRVAHRDLLAFLRDGKSPIPPADDAVDFGAVRHQGYVVQSAFLQLAYPWLRTHGSDNLPDALESPDAVLAGLLARNALARGTFRSAVKLAPPDVYDFDPKLPNPDGDDVLESHVSRFGDDWFGFALLSDVTSSSDKRYQQAPVSRLVACVLRAARLIGEDAMFDVHDERLWSRIVEGLGTLLNDLWLRGAIVGDTPADAYSVRCDRTTMSQDDLDAGRVIAEVGFDAAFSIDRINVLLTMSEGGRVSLAPARAA